MPGFWEYFQQFSDKLNEKQNTLFDRQFNLANMWNQNAQQESQAAQNYMNMQSGLLGQRAGIAQAVGEGERFDKSYKLSQDEAAFEKDKFARLLEQQALDRASNEKVAGINASGRGGGDDMGFAEMFFKMAAQMQADNAKSVLQGVPVRGAAKRATRVVTPTPQDTLKPQIDINKLGNLYNLWGNQ